MNEDKDRLVYHTDEHITVILTGAKFLCTNCNEWKPASEFGLRHIHHVRGLTIRNQAQCSKCR